MAVEFLLLHLLEIDTTELQVLQTLEVVAVEGQVVMGKTATHITLLQVTVGQA
jgi:hypothetical protein